MVEGYAETVFGYDDRREDGKGDKGDKGDKGKKSDANANAAVTMMQSSRNPGTMARRNIRIADLVRYRLPVAGLLSILHRLSGAAMFLLLPLALRWLSESLASPAGFAEVVRCAGSWWFKLLLLGAFWALMHHACAGVRFLLLDLHRGVDRAAARRSAIAAFAISLALTAMFAVWLLMRSGRAG